MLNLSGIVHYSNVSFVSSHAVYMSEQFICYGLSFMDIILLLSLTNPKLSDVLFAGQHQRLEEIRMHREVTRQSLRLEIARLIVGSYIGLREPGDGTLWKCRPPPKRKR
jgi:hypothetical protein